MSNLRFNGQSSMRRAVGSRLVALQGLAARPGVRGAASAGPAAKDALLPGDGAARACAAAILSQHRAFLGALDDAAYAFESPLLRASVGQHTRHSLDHLRKPVELLRRAQGRQDDDAEDAVLQYDLRQRRTDVETSRAAATALIDALLEDLRAIGARSLFPSRARTLLWWPRD